MGKDTTRNMYSSFPEINKLCKVSCLRKYIKRNIWSNIEIYKWYNPHSSTQTSLLFLKKVFCCKDCDIRINKLWFHFDMLEYNNHEQGV